MPNRKFLCPKCKQSSGVEIVYGYPSESLFEEAERDEVVLGGCTQMEGAPNRQCLGCGRQWPNADMSLD